MNSRAARALAAIAAMLLPAAAVCLPAGAATQSPPGCSSPVVPGGLGTSVPVLLVHGFNERPAVWNKGTPTMLETIDAIPNVKAVTFNYSMWNTMWVTNYRIGACLATWITSLATTSKNAGGPGKVIIVAHSMGGLAVRCAVDPKCVNHDHTTGPPWQTADSSQIGLVITLGTPNLGSWLATPGRPFLLSAACQLIPLCAGRAKAFAAGSQAAQALQEQSLTPETPSADLAMLKSWSSIGVPLDALAGRITLTTSLFGRGPFCIFCRGELGDGVVTVGSAQGEATPAESTTIDCGYIPVSDLSPYSVIYPLAAPVTLKCWHLTETTDPVWQAAVVTAIRPVAMALSLTACTSSALTKGLLAANPQLKSYNWTLKSSACQGDWAVAQVYAPAVGQGTAFLRRTPSGWHSAALSEVNCSAIPGPLAPPLPTPSLAASLLRQAGICGATPSPTQTSTPGFYFATSWEPQKIYVDPAYPKRMGIDNHDWITIQKVNTWGSDSMSMTGVLNYDNCQPDCASGQEVTFPVQVIATAPKTCTVQIGTVGSTSPDEAYVYSMISVSALSGKSPSFLLGNSVFKSCS